MTANDIITSALRKIGAIAEGETPSGNAASDGLDVLNDMLDSWSTERLMIFTVSPQEFNLTTAQSYTMGPGGDFSITPRPVRIDRGVLKVNSNPTYPLELPLKEFTDQEWASITLKSLSNTYPEGYWDTDDFPLRKIYFWPVPSGVSLSVVFYIWTQLSQFTDLSTTLTFPPGYAKAIRNNLAVELSPEYDREPSPTLSRMASMSKLAIQSVNTATPLMTCDRAVQSPSTIPGVSRAEFLGGRF